MDQLVLMRVDGWWSPSDAQDVRQTLDNSSTVKYKTPIKIQKPKGLPNHAQRGWPKKVTCGLNARSGCMSLNLMAVPRTKKFNCQHYKDTFLRIYIVGAARNRKAIQSVRRCLRCVWGEARTKREPTVHTCVHNVCAVINETLKRLRGFLETRTLMLLYHIVIFLENMLR